MCTRTHFSGLRLGTSNESGIQEAQYLYSLPKRLELRSMLAEDALAKALHRAEKFGDLVTADHKVLNEGGESRDNHRYAVGVQGLVTRWIQSSEKKAC